MKRTAKYLIFMLTVVLIVSLIGIAFAWYSSNTTVKATSSATAAVAENVDLEFLFTSDDDGTNKVYLSAAQLITDYYGRTIYTGEEGWVAKLDDGTSGMVGNVTQTTDGSLHLRNPDDDTIGNRDHVFTLFYYIELSSKKDISFALSMNSVKIFKNGATLRGTDGNEVADSEAEFPMKKTPTAEGEATEVVGDGKIVKVKIGAGVYYFRTDGNTVYKAVDEADGTLSSPCSDNATSADYAVFDKTTNELTVGNAKYVLSGHEAGKSTSAAHYFAADDEEAVTETAGLENFVFNAYDVSTLGATADDIKTAISGKIYNKAHEGDYNIYGLAETMAVPEKIAITKPEGAETGTARVLLAITHFQKIEQADGAVTTAVTSPFAYSAKEYMKSHFKFKIKAEVK